MQKRASESARALTAAVSHELPSFRTQTASLRWEGMVGFESGIWLNCFFAEKVAITSRLDPAHSLQTAAASLRRQLTGQ